MPVAIPNFGYSYLRKGKPVFVPTNIGRRIGNEIKEVVEGAYTFDPIYFHLRRGGHVAAMHHHRDNQSFARIDISNFFYSISRRRVQSALDRAGVCNARFYAQWSTVVSPFGEPRYALPYGFVQSPILASLVVATSDLGRRLLGLPASIKVGVYVDDISLSSDDESGLQEAYNTILDVLAADGFAVSLAKLRPPAQAIDIFNCDLTHGKTTVMDARVDAFASSNPSREAEEAFVAYCASVELGNQPWAAIAGGANPPNDLT
jgi:Reverse transcriptase (RNA-dependent DNA polymerase)